MVRARPEPNERIYGRASIGTICSQCPKGRIWREFPCVMKADFLKSAKVVKKTEPEAGLKFTLKVRFGDCRSRG